MTQASRGPEPAERRVRVGGGLALMAVVSLGCYTYTPLATATPPAGTRVSLVLSDQGRVQAASSVGPQVARVEGALTDATDADYVVQVSNVIDIQGRKTKWTGETVPLPRTAVANGYEKRLSGPRTGLLLVGVGAAVVGIMAGFDLFGFGSGGGDGGGGTDPSDQ